VTTTIKIVLTGDNHLNYYSQTLGSKLSERRAQIGRAWRKTIDFAIQKKVDIYLNVGDMFDQISPRNPPRAKVVRAFGELKNAGVKSFIISGTHESPAIMLDGASPHALLQEAELATVFENTQSFGQEVIEVEGTRVSVAGISTERRLRSGMDPLENLTIPAGADFNIAMLHYSIEKMAPPYWEESMIRLASLERNSQINLFAMGHIHQHIKQQLGDSLILYPGGTERFDFGEAENETGFYYIEIEDHQVKVDYIKTESQPMTQLKIHTSQLSEANATKTILDALLVASNQRGLFQLVLEGEMSFEDYVKIDFSRLFNEGRKRNFFYEHLDRITPTVEGIELKASEVLNPRNELLSLANQAIERASLEEKKSWQRALNLAVSHYDFYVGK